MSEIVKGNIVYENGKPVFHAGQFQNLKKCPNCKCTEIQIGNSVETQYNDLKIWYKPISESEISH